MKCPQCHTNDATRDPLIGVLPCVDCRTRQKTMGQFSTPVEFTTEQIKEERKAFKKDVIQPWRDDHLSKEYIEEYGLKNIVATEEDIKNASYVWNEGEYYKK